MRIQRLVFSLIFIVFMLSLIIVGLGYFYFMFSRSGRRGSSDKVTIIVEPGDGLSSVARRLKEKGVIKDDRLFVFYARMKRAEGRIRKGEYEFAIDSGMKDVLESLVLGRQKYYRLVVIPGSNIWQVAEMIDLNRVWSGERFLGLCRDKNFIKGLGIDADSLEGYLYPDTYQFYRYDSEEYIIKAMVKRFKERWTDEYEMRARSMGININEVITIASIIEKEAGLSEERPLVSAVIYNRLRKNMGLFMDPTVIYGLMPDFDGNLTRSDLNRWTPYNTYKIKGLPPGPICNPSDSSIRAALWPADVNYLYFVSKGDGSHHFSSKYAEHLKAVEEYQRAGVPLKPEEMIQPEMEEQSGETVAPEQ